MAEFSRAARTYIVAVTVAGFVLVGALLYMDRAALGQAGTVAQLGDVWLLVFFVAFGVAMSLAPVGTAGGILWSGNLAPLYAATLVLSPGAAGLVAMIGSIDQRIPGRSVPWYRFLFNRAQFGLTYGLAALSYRGVLSLYHVPCGSRQALCLAETLTQLSAAVIAIVVVAVLNTAIVVTVVALTNRTNFRNVAYQGLQGLLLSYVGLAPLGGLVAYLTSNRTLAAVGVSASISILLLVYRQLSQRSYKLQHVIEGSYVSQSRLIDKKDRSTFGHSERVGILAEATATRLGLSVELTEQIRIGATLHDIGKIAIPDAILHKPGALSPEEWEIMKTHCDEGYEVLKEQEVLTRAADIVRSHHENYDGSGYPQALAGRAIPVGGRIARIADSYDCMVSVRDYRAWVKSPTDALAEIDSLAGKWYDPEIVRAFIAVVLERQPAIRETYAVRELQPSGYKETLSHRPFARLLAAHGLSNLGDMMTTTGLALTAFASTKSILAVGAVFVAKALPNLLLGAVAGPAADRVDRKGLLIIMDLSRAALVALLPFLINRPLLLILAITLLLSTATAFFNPARAAALPDIVPIRMLLSANSAISFVERITEILGYGSAALIIVVGGIPLVFAIDALTFAVSAGLILSITFPPVPQRVGRVNWPAIRADLADGIREIQHHRLLRVLMPFSLLMVAAGSALLPLMVPLAVDHLHSGQAGFGVLEASIAAGATLGSLMSGFLHTVRRGTLMLLGAIGMGGASILAGLSPVLPMAVIFFFAGGVANIILVIAMVTVIQEVTEPSLRGRIFAARYTLIQLGTCVGIGYAAVTMSRLPSGDGASFMVAVSGGLMVLIALSFSFSATMRSV